MKTNALDWFRRKKPTPGRPNLESVLDNVTIALGLAEQVIDIAQVAPFVAPAAALLSKIINSYKDWKRVNENRDLLAQHIVDLTGDVCATVLRMQETNYSDSIGRLRQDLEKYAILIAKASQFIKDNEVRGKLAHFANPNQTQDELDKLNRELDSFGARLRNNRLVDLCINQSTNAQTLKKVYDVVVQERLEKWLRTPPDMTEKQHETEKLRMKGTGQWLFKSNSFIEWEDNPGVLWIEGTLSDKIHSASVIHELFARKMSHSGSLAIAFFYFDFRNKEAQNIEIALRRIVLQLSAQAPHPYETLDKHHELSNGQKLPSYQDLEGLLYKLLHELGRTYLILDALDECDSSDFNQLVGLVSLLKSWSETQVHLLITSQTRPLFTQHFGCVPCITLQVNIIQQDIELFVTSEIGINSAFEIWRPSTAQVAERITQKSNGMFRLAACLLIELSRCMWPEDEELDKIIERLPNDLFGIYDRFMLAIPKEWFAHAEAALRWIIFKKWFGNKFILVELADAIAFNFSGLLQYTYKPNRREANISTIPKLLAGLVVGEGTVTLAHASVQDYLLSGTSNKNLTTSMYPLAKYAANHWYYHLVHSHNLNDLLPLGMQLLQDGFFSQQQSLTVLRPLYFCCHQGYLECASFLLRNGADVNHCTQDGTSSLMIACRRGHTEIVQLLLENGANVNLQGGKYGTVLVAACLGGKIEIVNLLLGNGADINTTTGGTHGNALIAAASKKDNLEIVRVLLAKGANVNAAGGDFGSALATATIWGHFDILHLLLDNGADINFALTAACLRGDQEIVSLFLENGANVNIVGGEFGMVHLLLKHGVDIKSQGSRALKEATQNKRDHIVALLLEHGAVMDEDNV
ncbi:hypothetical protein K438DRAFT_1832586 [Mycena galopus ATCC 62051]|nr:hypothetical protein K438DRAFT_1832586 [Mycena galopus ATCC 62051]